MVIIIKDIKLNRLILLLFILSINSQLFAKKVYKGDELAEGLGLSYVCSTGAMLKLCKKHMPEKSEQYGKYLINWNATLSESEKYIKQSEKTLKVTCPNIQRKIISDFSKLNKKEKTRDCEDFESQLGVFFKQKLKKNK